MQDGLLSSQARHDRFSTAGKTSEQVRLDKASEDFDVT